MITQERMALLKASRDLAHTPNPPGQMYIDLLEALSTVMAADTGVKVQFVITGDMVNGPKPTIQ